MIFVWYEAIRSDADLVGEREWGERRRESESATALQRNRAAGGDRVEDVSFTERELDIMSHLWAKGSGTVAEVRGSLPDAPSYTGVLKLLQILEDKGMVRHEQEGRAYRYFPEVEQQMAGEHALRRVVDKIFQGSAEMALARLVTGVRVSKSELQRMRRLLDEAVEESGP